MMFVFALAAFWLHLDSILEAKMEWDFPRGFHFFHLFRLGGPNCAPREAKAPQWSQKESPRTPKDAHKSSQSSTLGTKTDPKRGQGIQKDPKDVPKVVTKLKSSQKSSQREAKTPNLTHKTSQKSSQTMKHGGGTGVSHWIFVEIRSRRAAVV